MLNGYNIVTCQLVLNQYNTRYKRKKNENTYGIPILQEQKEFESICNYFSELSLVVVKYLFN